MHVRRSRTQLQHLPDHRHAPAARLRRAGLQGAERRAHGGGIGVVAVVDHGQRGGVHLRLEHRAAPVGGLQRGEHVQGQCRLHARSERGGDDSGGVDRLMGAGELQAEAVAPADHVHLARPAVGAFLIGQHAHGRVLGATELQKEGGFRAFHRGHEARREIVVGRNDADAVGRQPLEDLRLGVGDRLHGAEIFKVCGRDLGDHRHMGPDHGDQVADLSGIVHAHLEHAALARLRHAREGQRHAPMIIVAFLAPVGGARRAEDGGQGFLHARLAHRAGDAHPAGGAAVPRAFAKPAQSGQHVVHDDLRPVRAVGPRDQDGRGALVQRGLRELMAVALVGQRHEQIARLQGASVDRDARRRPAFALQAPARRGGGFGRGPQRRGRAHGSTSLRWPRMISGSLNGRTLSPTIWPVS